MSNNTQRGNFCYDQVCSDDRQGDGEQFQMFSGPAPVAGHAAVFDANGNVVDGGAPPGGGGGAVSGTPNHIALFTDANTLGDSVIVESSGNIGIGNPNPAWPLDVNGGMHGWFANLADDTAANNGITCSIVQTTATGTCYGVLATSSGAAGNNLGGQFKAANAQNNTGLYCGASGGQGTDIAIHISDTPAAATNYAIYSDSPAQSSILGNIGVGKAIPNYAVDVSGDINITGQYRINGSPVSGVLPIRLVSADYTMSNVDYTAVATAPGITVTLPAAPATGQIANVKNGNAAAGQTITVAAGGIFIDTATSVILDAAASVQAQWDGSQWRILLGFGVFS